MPNDDLDPALLSWAVAAAPSGPEPLVRGESLSQSGTGGPWLLRFSSLPQALVLHVGDPAVSASRQGFATEVAALEVAAAHGLPAPRVIAADLTGATSGRLAILQTAMPGSSRIPQRRDPERLRALGRTAAAIHAVDVDESAELPRRSRSLTGADFGVAAAGRSGELLAEGRELLQRLQPPPGRHGLTHGDLWHGNTLWDRGAHTGTVDWDFAGVGSAGVDLGSLRCDAAVLFGVEAAGDVLDGWERARGAAAEAVPYWDVVAALSTPADMAVWVPNFHAQGRDDLDTATVTARRDDFLARALEELR